ncbi:MAG: WecB/TagA/CpsF family glycosyltransferase [Ignavibacteriales bacterium]|nr:WecB/TagA/CpsF family glycosyltransferase [Ignavibacteriales bacterium]
MKEKINILGVHLDFISHEQIVERIKNAVITGNGLTISYANTHVLNFAFSDRELYSNLQCFDILYPDGIGTAIAGKLHSAGKHVNDRTVATDLLEILHPYLIGESVPVYFFGDTVETISQIGKFNPGIHVAGMHAGYNFTSEKVVGEINACRPGILIVGLGTPLQEAWIKAHKDMLHVPVIIAVGEGIRVFAGNKVRGAKIIQRIGLEWLVRLLYDPRRLWKRYILGIPLFMFRVLKQKLVL